jgi:tartrate dehydrogenase/decarboxylase/D-malate dehydrogenase
MMLEHLGEPEAANAILDAIEAVLAAGAVLTPDLGGSSSTVELGVAIADHIGSPAPAVVR